MQGHVSASLLEHVRTVSLEEIHALLCDVEDGEVAAPPGSQVRQRGCLRNTSLQEIEGRGTQRLNLWLAGAATWGGCTLPAVLQPERRRQLHNCPHSTARSGAPCGSSVCAQSFLQSHEDMLFHHNTTCSLYAGDRDKLACAPFVLHLTTLSELRSSQSLDSLTAVLGCSICLPKLEELGDHAGAGSAQERQAVCLSLWHAVNWLREVVSCFSLDSSR
jgi:hypothetical protein